MADASGFPYPDLSGPHIEAVRVAVDSDDQPIMAVAAKRLVEMYLYVDPAHSPAVRIDALKAIHHDMATALREIGYTEGEIFLPPEIAGKFGRRLERTFGWVKNRWENWTLRF